MCGKCNQRTVDYANTENIPDSFCILENILDSFWILTLVWKASGGETGTFLNDYKASLFC